MFEPSHSRLAIDELLEGKNEAIKEILKDTIPGRETAGNTAQKIRVGGTYEEALEDFDKIGLIGVKDIPGKEMKIGFLPDGKVVNVRLKSDQGSPTLEIYNPINDQKVKVRYGN